MSDGGEALLSESKEAETSISSNPSNGSSGSSGSRDRKSRDTKAPPAEPKVEKPLFDHDAPFDAHPASYELYSSISSDRRSGKIKKRIRGTLQRLHEYGAGHHDLLGDASKLTYDEMLTEMLFDGEAIVPVSVPALSPLSLVLNVSRAERGRCRNIILPGRHPSLGETASREMLPAPRR